MPPLHPDWLIVFWMKTPFLNKLDPHLIMLFLLAVLLLVLFRRKRKKKQEPDTNEEMFHLLLRKKAVIEKQMIRIEEQMHQGDVTKDQYDKAVMEYVRHLEDVKKELLRFT